MLLDSRFCVFSEWGYLCISGCTYLPRVTGRQLPKMTIILEYQPCEHLLTAKSGEDIALPLEDQSQHLATRCIVGPWFEETASYGRAIGEVYYAMATVSRAPSVQGCWQCQHTFWPCRALTMASQPQLIRRICHMILNLHRFPFTSVGFWPTKA